MKRKKGTALTNEERSRLSINTTEYSKTYQVWQALNMWKHSNKGLPFALWCSMKGIKLFEGELR
jgi:hypothetical protein